MVWWVMTRNYSVIWHTPGPDRSGSRQGYLITSDPAQHCPFSKFTPSKSMSHIPVYYLSLLSLSACLSFALIPPHVQLTSFFSTQQKLLSEAYDLQWPSSGQHRLTSLTYRCSHFVCHELYCGLMEGVCEKRKPSVSQAVIIEKIS